jgi:hypothetical protein
MTEPDAARATPPGPACHRCGEPAEVQWQRHATDAEYAALADSPLRPLDGRLHVAVFACGDHEVDPVCDGHPPLDPPPCPKCNANPGECCTKGNGDQRRNHRDRVTAVVPETCRHAHRPDCTGYGHCACTPDDPEPVRDLYEPPPAVGAADMAAARQAIHDAELAWYAKLLRDAGNDGQEANRLARAAFGEFLAEHTGPEPAAG